MSGQISQHSKDAEASFEGYQRFFQRGSGDWVLGLRGREHEIMSRYPDFTHLTVRNRNVKKKKQKKNPLEIICLKLERPFYDFSFFGRFRLVQSCLRLYSVWGPRIPGCVGIPILVKNPWRLSNTWNNHFQHHVRVFGPDQTPLESRDIQGRI